MPTLIQDVGRVSKMIVVLDGIDYMEPADLAMRALPTLLPTQRGVSPVRFVVTATPRSAAHAALLKRNPPPQVVSLGEVDAADRKDIVTKALAPYGKKLGTRWGGKISAGSVLVRKPDARLPEYLAVGVAYLRTTVSHAQLLPAVRSLPPTLPKLHDFIFETCEHRCGGKPPVSAVVAPLALSAPTGGLTEVQLRVFTGLPTATIESILTHLSVYLYTDPTGGKFTLSSSAMLKAAKRRYCSSKAEESTMHRKLGMFHLTGVNPPGGKLFGLSDAAVNWLQAEDNSVRGVLYHSVEAGAWEILSRCAADVGFFECLAVHGMVPEGLSALRLAVASGKVVGKKLTPFADFLEKNGQVITLHPQLAVQAVRNSTFGGPVHQLAAAAEVTVPWFQREDLQLAAPLCASTRHTGSPVAALAMSKDGRFVAVGTRDWKIRVILQRDSKQRFLLTRHTSVVTVLNFTPGNDGLVSGSADGAVFLWSMRDGAVLLHLPAAHAKTVHGVCFGKASDYFATCSDDTTVKVWDVTHQRCIKTYREHTGPVSCIRSHVEGRLFASGAWDTTLKLYAGINTDTFYLATLHTGLKAISDVCWLPSLVPMVAAASCDGKVRVFDVNAQAPFITIDGHYGRTVRSITYSPDGKWMISGDAQGCVKVWRSSTGEEIAACTGHHKGVRKVLVAPDNKTLLTGAADSQVRSWNRENSATQTLHSARVTQCALHQGRLAFSSSRDGTLKVVDLAEGATASSAAGKSAASAGSQKRGGASFLTIAHAKEGASDSVAPPPLPVTSFAVSHDGTRVVTASIDGLIRAFKVAPGLGGSHSGHAPFLIFKGHRNVVSGVYVNKANELFSVSWDCSIRKWALTAGRAGEMPGEAAGDVTTTAVLCVKRDAHSMEISGVRGTAEGDTIATTSFDQTIRVWSCGNLAHVRTLCAHTNWTTAVAYHPSDPALLATGGLDGRVCLWDLSKPSDEALCWETFATNLTTLTGAESSVHAVQFLNDELLLVAADPGVLAWKVTPSFSGVSGKLTCADAPAGVFFTEAPCVSLAAAVNAAGAFQVWCGDVIGTTYNLTLRDLAGEWSVRELQLHVASDVPHAVARRDGESQMEVDSEEGASTCEMESYTTWETVSDAEIFPGRGGCFKKFASGAARRQYLMNARKEYVEGLKAMKKGQRPQPSPACQEYFNQSVKTMEVISMLQNLGVV
ncbi:putative WD repeat-containing protein [Diplonema papillatum]|nr:putative WD repeat-containing protein [Diplonema papillatum]